MLNIEGKVIVSCCRTNDTRKYGPCATCMYARDWTNTPFLKEDDAGYCCDSSAKAEGDEE